MNNSGQFRNVKKFGQKKILNILDIYIHYMGCKFSSTAPEQLAHPYLLVNYLKWFSRVFLGSLCFLGQLEMSDHSVMNIF